MGIAGLVGAGALVVAVVLGIGLPFSLAYLVGLSALGGFVGGKLR